jgi:hypothetical protein
MEEARVVPLPEEPKRTRQRVLSAIAARARLESSSPPVARAWINGRAVGEKNPRLAGLSRSHA